MLYVICQYHLPFTISVPSQPPQNVQATPLSSQSIMIVWGPPPLYTLHGILQGYKIFYKPVRDDEGTPNLLSFLQHQYVIFIIYPCLYHVSLCIRSILIQLLCCHGSLQTVCCKHWKILINTELFGTCQNTLLGFL